MKLLNIKLSLYLIKHRKVKTYGERKYSSTILDLIIRSRGVVSFTPRSLCPQGKSRFYPLCTRLAGPQSRFGRREEGKILLPLPEIEHRPATDNYKFYVVQSDITTSRWKKKIKEQPDEIHIEIIHSDKNNVKNF